MKLKIFPSILGFCAVSIFFACANDTKPAENAATETTPAASTSPVSSPVQSAPAEMPVVTTAPADGAPGQAIEPIITQVPPPNPAAQPVKPQEPPQNAAGVWHYTCPKGCKGGGGAATPCAKCGTTLAHNAAYHPPAPAGGQPQGAANPGAAKKPEPPQNAAGVWHYTCSDGCPGGAGAATPCAKCGKTLAHNAAYHQ